MPEHRVGTQEEWQAERDELLGKEKELTRLNDELAQRRRQLPWVPVEKEYSFETEDGTKSLADLFDGRSQLLVYHFMFGPAYEAGCPVCSSIADTLDPNAVHLRARDVTLICSSRAAGEADRLQRSHGLELQLGLHSGQRLPPRPQLPAHRGGAEAVPEGRDATDRRAECESVRRRRGDVRDGGARAQRLHQVGRRRLPNLRDDRPRARAGNGLLRPTRPDADGAEGGR